MAIESVSALSPISAYVQRAQASQPAQETQKTAQTSAPSTAQTTLANAPGTSQIMQANEPRQTASAGAAPMANLSGPETMGNWNWAVAQPGVSASPSETEGSIRSASTQISQAYGSGSTSPADIRNASQAYRNEASARDQAAQQQQGGGTRTMDVFA
jgi:hypothetical protein